MKGLRLRIRNDGLSAIAKVIITIRSARSFDARHAEFRDGLEFKAVRFFAADLIRAAHAGHDEWLVCKKADKDHLFAGPVGAGSLMVWPPLDFSEVQRWLLSLSVEAQTFAPSAASLAKPLTEIKLNAVICWDKRTNEFSIEAGSA